MKAEYARLNHTLTLVTRERDLAVKEKNELQAKLENLGPYLELSWQDSLILNISYNFFETDKGMPLLREVTSLIPH